MKHPLILAPHEILYRETMEVTEITDELIDLLDEMHATMVAYDGIGIAAPQVGQSLRVALVELDEEFGLVELINPEIVNRKGSDIDVEGCLSFPDVYGTVERAKEVTVRYFDREGDEYEITATETFARALQHEIDHLNGQVFVDKIIERIAPEELEKYVEEHQG